MKAESCCLFWAHFFSGLFRLEQQLFFCSCLFRGCQGVLVFPLVKDHHFRRHQPRTTVWEDFSNLESCFFENSRDTRTSLVKKDLPKASLIPAFFLKIATGLCKKFLSPRPGTNLSATPMLFSSLRIC